MTKLTQISKEELEPIITARGKALEAAKIADNALKDARLADLEFKVQIQQLYLAKGLDSNCQVDISNGAVAWPNEINEPDPDEKTAGDETKPVEPKTASKRRGKKATEPEIEG